MTRARHRVEAFLAGRGEAEAGAGHGQVEDFQGEGADNAVEEGGAPGQVGADDPALAVGQGAGGEVDGFAGDEVEVVDAVAAGVDAGIGGLEAAVDHEAAAGGEHEAGPAGQVGVGGGPHGGDDQVGGQDRWLVTTSRAWPASAGRRISWTFSSRWRMMSLSRRCLATMRARSGSRMPGRTWGAISTRVVSRPQRSLTASAISQPMAPAPRMTTGPPPPWRCGPGRPWRRRDWRR